MQNTHDILWSNSATGEVQIWFMDDHKITRRSTVVDEQGRPIPIGPPWSIAGAGNFDHVRSPIDVKYQELGGRSSWLGHPLGNELDFAQAGRARQFEHGAIYWWADTGAVDMGDVTMQYKGMYCFGETDESSDSDEPYVSFGLVPVPPGNATAARSRIYTDVDGGDARPDHMELYRGSPLGAQLGVVLADHDHGDPDKFVGEIKLGVEAPERALGPFVATSADQRRPRAAKSFGRCCRQRSSSS